MASDDPVALLSGLEGRGIEIGAFHSPLAVGPRASVEYVDLYPPEVSRRYFPEVAAEAAIVTPGVIAPADRLPFSDSSQAFVLTSHMLDHLRDPIGALKEWHRVLRPGGIIFLRLPDHRGDFDRLRTRTPLSHLLQDHTAAPGSEACLARDFDHEWARWVNKLADPRQIDFWARLLVRAAYPIHFHCWQPHDIRELLTWLAAHERTAFEIVAEHARADHFEFTFVARARK